MVVLGARFAVGLGSVDCEDGERIEVQEMLWATAAVSDGCGDRGLAWQLLCTKPELPPYQMKLKSPISSLLVI